MVLAEDISAEGHVVLAVRNRRLAPRYLNGHSHWALEPDTYDTFRREWASLSAFLGLAPERRQRLLGRSAPRRPAPECWTPASPPATTAPEVVARALAAPDWFVLCGPPGTGKTRAVLRELAEQLYKEDKHTLLAAYTNRAVDEICEQLVAAGLPFIRVGSRLGTAPPYRPYLLDNMLRDCPNRQAVRDRLKNCPFYVGTVASLLGKPELFILKQFDLAVVDEASQVLEAPMLALLAKVNKFILIGDHRQLPAVVAQEPEASAVAEEVADLLRDELGLTNMRNSYFERLFRKAEAHWPHAHGTLADHYRMHAELVALVNDDFYEGQLRCPLPWQQEPLHRAAWPAPTDELTRKLHDQRLIFVPHPPPARRFVHEGIGPGSRPGGPRRRLRGAGLRPGFQRRNHAGHHRQLPQSGGAHPRAAGGAGRRAGAAAAHAGQRRYRGALPGFAARGDYRELLLPPRAPAGADGVAQRGRHRRPQAQRGPDAGPTATGAARQ